MGWKATDLFRTLSAPAFGMPGGFAGGGTQNILFRGFAAGEGGNGTLYWMFREPSLAGSLGGDWRSGAQLAPDVGGPVYQFTRLAGYYFPEQQTVHFDYMAGDRSGDIIEIYRDADGWHTNNLTISAHDTAKAIDGPSGFTMAGLQQIFFRGTDQHVHELWWDIAGWHPRDLNIATGCPLALGAPASYGFAAQSTQHAVYVAVGGGFDVGPVRELWRDPSGNWHDGGDLTAITGAPVPATGVPAGYAFEGEFTQHVFYRGTDGNIHELRWATSTGGWHYWGKPTALAGAPAAEGNPAAYVFDAQGTEHVAYLGVDGHIHELWRIAGEAWSHNNLSARTAALPAATDPVAFIDGSSGTQHVAYTSADRHVVELTWDPIASNPQFLEDVDGDGIADIVAFGVEGVWTARGKGDGTFDWPYLATADFGYDAGGWRVEKHVRLVGDVTGDAREDIVGFGDAGVYVARSTGGGAFGPTHFAIADFGYEAGWRVDKHPRMLADLRNNGRQDIVGFGDAGVYVALSNGDGTFAYTPVPVLSAFGYDAGWRADRHLRIMADLRGKGTADIIGFFDDGVWVALGWGDGTFQDPKFVIADLGYNSGWRVDKHPRLIADVTGDGKADLVGFGDAGVYVAVSQGGGNFGYSPAPMLEDFGYEAGGWRVGRNPRFLARVAASQRADIVGFGNVGVRTALSTSGGGFEQAQIAAPDFGYQARV